MKKKQMQMKKKHVQMKKKHVQLSFISCVISRNAFFRDTHTACTPPVLFQVQPENSLLAQTSPAFACIATSSPCILAASDSEWPPHLAQRRWRRQTSRFLSMRQLASYSHLGDMRAKINHRWHCTCFRELCSLPRFQRTGDGRVHRPLA